MKELDALNGTHTLFISVSDVATHRTTPQVMQRTWKPASELNSVFAQILSLFGLHVNTVPCKLFFSLVHLHV